METVHGTSVALDGGGVLLRGPSGSGKSDLALRLIDGGAALVADDQTALSRKGEEILASAPPQIVGRMEVRGLGVIRLSAVSDIPVRIVVDIVPADEVERLPKPAETMLLGVALPVLRLPRTSRIMAAGACCWSPACPAPGARRP
jgi:serine kinase of HPr protein (carbohydrate metabolism regulator)